jgi:hypothetical protein
MVDLDTAMIMEMSCVVFIAFLLRLRIRLGTESHFFITAVYFKWMLYFLLIHMYQVEHDGGYVRRRFSVQK